MKANRFFPFAAVAIVITTIGCAGDDDANYWEENASAKCKDGGYSFEEDCGDICVGRGGVERYVNKDCSGSSHALIRKSE
ncbi:MAG: hypothetical protein ACO1SV_13675 [Fimbriimonas sp.]